jgi:hypothetical protein
MPALSTLLDATMHRADGLYGVVPTIVDGAAAGAIAVQDDQLAILRPKDYTPGQVPLTDANLFAAIQAAYDAAVLAGGNTIIQIPFKTGGWNIGTTDKLDLHGSGYGQNIWIEGPATINVPAASTQEIVRMRGSTPASAPWGRGGLRNMQFLSSNGHATVLVLDACVRTQFLHVRVEGFQLGTGIKCRDYQGGGNNSQYCMFFDVQCNSCGTNLDIEDLSASHFFNCGFDGANTRQIEIDHGCDVSFHGYTIQGAASPAVRIGNAYGGCRVSMHDGYHESTCATLIQMPDQSGAESSLRVANLTAANVATVFDIGAFCNLHVDGVLGTDNSTVVVKARNAESIYIKDAQTTAFSDPTKFDLDSASKQVATFIGAGVIVGGSTPMAATLTELLKPHAVEIWDPAVVTKRALSGSDVTSLTGVLHGTVLTPSSGTANPQWTASNALFSGRPSITFSSGNKALAGTLAVPVPTGSRAALFCVLRMQNATIVAGARVAIGMADIQLLANDTDNTASQTWALPPGFAQNTTGATGTDVHAVYGDADPGNVYHSRLLVDGQSSPLGNVVSASVSPDSAIVLGGNPSGTYTSDFVIAYAAVLFEPLSAQEIARLFALSQLIYGTA